jgi:hypothetical protein
MDTSFPKVLPLSEIHQFGASQMPHSESDSEGHRQ